MMRAAKLTILVLLLLIIPFVSATTEDCNYDTSITLSADLICNDGLNITSTGELNTNDYNITVSGNAINIDQYANLTITSSSNVSANDVDVNINGTFNASATSNNIELGSLVVNNGGTYDATSGTTFITSRNPSLNRVDFNSGSTLTHNSGTFELIGSPGVAFFDNPAGVTFWNVVQNSTSKASANDHLDINGDLTVVQGEFEMQLTSDVAGDVLVQGGTLDLEDDGDAHSFKSLTISSGTVESTAGTLTIDGETAGNVAFSNNAGGTFTHNNGLVDITGTGNPEINDQGTNNLYNLEISDGATWTNSLTIDNDLTVQDYFREATNDPLTVTGDVLIENSGLLSATGDSSTYTFGSLTINSGGTYSATSGTTLINDETAGNLALDCDGTYTANSGLTKITTTTTATDLQCSSGGLYDLEIDTSDLITWSPSAVTINNDLTITGGTFRGASSSSVLTVTGDVSVTGTLGRIEETNSMNFGSLTINSGGTYSATNGTTNVTNDINSTVGSTMTLNSGTFEYCHFYRDGTVTGTATAYIQDCTPFSPVSVSPVNQLINYLTQIYYDWTHEEWSPLYRLIVWVTDDPTSPVLNITTNETFYNDTVTTYNETQYSWNVTPTDQSNENESTTVSFKVDLTLPEIVIYNPSEFNTTDQYYNTTESVILNVSINDTNLEGTNATIYNSSGVAVWTEEYTGLTESNYTWDNNTGTFPSGLYDFESCASDDHTQKDLPDKANYKALTNGKKGYKFEIQEDNPINIELVSKNKNNIKSSKVDKKKDRFSQTDEFENLPIGQNTFTYLVSSVEPMVWRSNTPYKGHLLTGDTWADFEADFYDKNGKLVNDAKYIVKQIDSYTFEVSITTSAVKIVFKSIGGVNIKCSDSQFRVNTLPVISQIEFGAEGNFSNETLHCNVTFSDGDPSQTWNATFNFYNQSGALELANDTSCTSTFCEGDIGMEYTIENLNITCQAFVYDGHELSADSNETVMVNNVPPSVPIPEAPINGESRFNNSDVRFNWSLSTDQGVAPVTYDLLIYNDSAGTLVINESNDISNIYQVIDMNDFVEADGYDRLYYWEVNASDGTSNSTSAGIQNFRLWASGGNCTYLNNTEIIQPLSKKYASTIDIDLQFEPKFADFCQYSITGGIENFTVACDENTTFDVDYDDNFTMSMYFEHVASESVCDNTIDFEVARSLDTIPTFYVGIMFFLFAIAGMFMYLSTQYKDEFQVTNGLLKLAGLGTAGFAVAMVGSGLREYIKIASIHNIFNTFYLVVILMITILWFWNLSLLLKKLLFDLKNKSKSVK